MIHDLGRLERTAGILGFSVAEDLDRRPGELHALPFHGVAEGKLHFDGCLLLVFDHGVRRDGHAEMRKGRTGEKAERRRKEELFKHEHAPL